MSQTTVMDRVYTTCLSIDGLQAIHPNGRPFPDEEPFSTPCLVLDLLDSKPEAATLANNKWHRYTILMTTYLGPPDLLPHQAQAIALPLADRLLDAFNADPFLTAGASAGSCFISDISEIVRNIDTYQQEGRCPKQQATLSVTEYM